MLVHAKTMLIAPRSISRAFEQGADLQNEVRALQLPQLKSSEVETQVRNRNPLIPLPSEWKPILVRDIRFRSSLFLSILPMFSFIHPDPDVIGDYGLLDVIGDW